MAGGNPLSIYIGGCWVVWGTQIIGLTIGGIDLDIVTKTKPVNVDQTGSSTISEFIIGRNLVFKIKMAETTVDNFFMILDKAGATQPNGPNTGVFVHTISGFELLEEAAPMLLRPVNAPDGSQDMYLPAVAYTGDMVFSYKSDQPMAWDLTFVAFPDTSRNLGYYGSSTVVQSLGSILTSGSGYNITDPVVGDRQFNFVEDRDGYEIASRTT